ncbi:ufm1-specific protease 2 [Aplysia californica]|uniref:Ufm1-specific protease 2 n=1 Tax=Aplysia californica TaxID=6500 RepID=A0ABM0ZZ33_APLCA|nr:ufm1-specific protease 2 [Aplysia californica]
MASSIEVSAKVLSAVTSSEWASRGIRGFLVGPANVQSPDDIQVTGVWHMELIDGNELKEDINACLSHFPCGNRVVGLVFLPSSNCSKSKSEADPACLAEEFAEQNGSGAQWLERLGLSQAAVLCLWRPGKSSEDAASMDSSVFLVSPESFALATITDTPRGKPPIRMRLKGNIPLTISTESKGEEALRAELDHELTRLQRHLQAGDLVYGLESNTVLIQSGGSVAAAPGLSWRTCGELYKNLGDVATGNKGKLGKAQTQPRLPVSILLRASTEANSENQYAPIIRHQTGSFQSVRVSLPMDILVDVEESVPMFDLYNSLSDAVLRQVNTLFSCLNVFTKNNKLLSPEVFHFHPSVLDSPVTIVYPRGLSDDELEEERKILHKHLCLPMDRPLLRRGASGLFLSSSAPGGYLLNTHLGLSDPPVKGGTVSTVVGYYSYHHYMQDKFDDDKWGCAYRSLQTLISWFRYQGYTDRNIPTHREIQKALVEIGDKEEKFVGSRQWIGSFEVSFVLDHLLGVTSKFISVNSGSELSSTGQQLAHHFQTQGTPVMIGGGVLAHTILGVSYSELTGDISFLILDPHYTGGEDLRTIHDKGWCGWKDMNFWNQTAHYNMCLPQRPACV